MYTFGKFLIIVLILSVFLLNRTTLAQQQQQQQRQQPSAVGNDTDGPALITSTTSVVSLSVSVTDRQGRAISNLGPNSFSVYDGERQQEISFFTTLGGPASIALVFDTSGSMDGRKLEEARRALARFIQSTGADDEFFLVGFDSRPRVLLSNERDADMVAAKFTYARADGQTALFDAVRAGAELLRRRAARPTRIVLVISDGEDNNSRSNMRETKGFLSESDAIVFAIGIGGGGFSPKGVPTGRDNLRELAQATGGRAFFPGDEFEMDEAFDRIGVDIRTLYSIGFYPEDGHRPGQIHKVSVKIAPGSQGARRDDTDNRRVEKPLIRVRRVSIGSPE